MVSFELLEADKYYKSLLEQIPRAKKRIVIAAMVMLWGERTAPIFIMLQDAIKRGVQVTVLLDTYTRLTYWYVLTGRSTAERLRQTFRTLENLSAQGAKVHMFGKIGFPPQKGRYHAKITIVDDTSYSFGGINFLDEALDNIDYMLVRHDAKLADSLEQTVRRACRNRPAPADNELKLDPQTQILFDGGRPGRSIIYERACELTAQAKRVYYASQMTPSGELAHLLHETDATLYFSRPEQMEPLASIAQAFDQQRYRVDNSYKGVGYIHAKTILFELNSGKKVCLSGSHNFSYRGVSYGTQEIAMQSTDPKLWDQFHAFIKRRIA